MIIKEKNNRNNLRVMMFDEVNKKTLSTLVISKVLEYEKDL